MTAFIKSFRPGYFGRRRDEKIGYLNAEHGIGNWKLVWSFVGSDYEFNDACILFYEWSYFCWFDSHQDDLDFICTNYGECIDNAETNIQSGLDYTSQEAFSTHIRDIALRNVISLHGRKFHGPADKILIIRSADTEGYKYGPGNIPFFSPDSIVQPSLAPKWAHKGSVEDFWQSNKYIAIRK